MIAKISQGGHFGGVHNYVFKEDATIITSQNLSQNPGNWGMNMELLANGNQRLKKPVMHFSLSLPPGVRLTDAQWQTAASTFANQIGATDATQWYAVRHADQKHDHIHIVINRHQLDDQVLNDFKIKLRSHEAAAEAARSVGLEPVLKPARDQQNLTKRGLSSEIRQSIDKAMKDQALTLQTLKAELAKDGIKIILNQSKSTGRISGISYQKEGHAPLKGSSLGKAYTAKALKERGLVLYGNNHHQKLHQAQPQSNQNQAAASVGGGLAGAELSRLRAKGRTGGLSQGDKDRAAKAARGVQPQQQPGMEM